MTSRRSMMPRWELTRSIRTFLPSLAHLRTKESTKCRGGAEHSVASHLAIRARVVKKAARHCAIARSSPLTTPALARYNSPRRARPAATSSVVFFPPRRRESFSTMTLEAIGAIPTPGDARARRDPLRACTVAVDTLDCDTRAEAFALFQHAYEGADRARFDHDLADKQLIILLRERKTRMLKGFSTVLVRSVSATAGRSGTLLFSGDTVIDREYWGQKQLQVAFTRLLVAFKLRRPLAPLYWFLISKGWRTYLLLANAFPRAVPRHDRPRGVDADLESLLHVLASERFGAQYDPVSGIIRYDTPHERVRPGLAPVTADVRANPHVRYFAERNPHHGDGDELACLAEVRAVDIAAIAARLAVTTARRRFLRWTR